MEQRAIVRNFIQKIGVDSEAADLYIQLSTAGQTSALQLAKATGISRTQVYRYLEQLQTFGLVSAEQLSYGTLYRALPLENIDGLLADREAETATLRRNLDFMAHTLQVLAGGTGEKANVHHYYGLAGLKQVNWNLTKADKEFRVFEAAHLSEHLDKAFSRRCRERYIERKLTTYDLTNATKVRAKDMEPYEPSRTFMRHIDPGVLAITFEMYIYNDVVTLLDYQKGHEMAMEVHHPALNTMMRQLFDAMWNMGTPLPISK